MQWKYKYWNTFNHVQCWIENVERILSSEKFETDLKQYEQCVMVQELRLLSAFPATGWYTKCCAAASGFFFFLGFFFTRGSEGLCWLCHHFFCPPDKRHSTPYLFIRQILLFQRDLFRYTRCIVCKEQWRCQKKVVDFYPFSDLCCCVHLLALQHNFENTNQKNTCNYYLDPDPKQNVFSVFSRVILQFALVPFWATRLYTDVGVQLTATQPPHYCWN